MATLTAEKGKSGGPVCRALPTGCPRVPERVQLGRGPPCLEGPASECPASECHASYCCSSWLMPDAMVLELYSESEESEPGPPPPWPGRTAKWTTGGAGTGGGVGNWFRPSTGETLEKRVEGIFEIKNCLSI